MMIASTPKPPYYAVIFTSLMIHSDPDYDLMAEELSAMLKDQEGFLGYETARSQLGITVSYWKDKAAIANWKKNSKHQLAQKNGKMKWYQYYKTRIAKIERDYDFIRQ